MPFEQPRFEEEPIIGKTSSENGDEDKTCKEEKEKKYVYPPSGEEMEQIKIRHKTFERLKELEGAPEKTMDVANEMEEIKKEICIDRLEIKRDSEGKIILHHATSASNYFKIERDSAIKPPAKTGERSWRLKGEEEPEKLEKVYLATKEEAELIAERLQNKYGGSVYILEVHVDEKNLHPDEDTKEKTWYKSLDALKTCSFKGEIKDYNMVGKLDFQLPLEKRQEYFLRSIKAKTPEEKEKIRQEFKDEIACLAAKEQRELKKILEQKQKEKAET